MISYHIAAAAHVGPFDGLSPESRQELADGLPRGAVRRFSENGLQLSRVMRDLDLRADEPVFMASQFAEARALEAFLDSFPTPSPARFQTSVHPSGVQQGRVAVEAPIAGFTPMTGGRHLALLTCRTALLSNADTVVILGGEEKGTWLVDIDIASPIGFAFGLRLTRAAAGESLGCLSWASTVDDAPTSGNLKELFDAISNRTPLRWSVPDIGSLRLDWQ